MKNQTRNSVILAVVVGASHWGAHSIFGVDAVVAAGITVTLAAGLGYWALHEYYS